MQKSDAYLNNINTGAELKIKQKTKKTLFIFHVLPSEVSNSRSSSRERSCVSCPGENSAEEKDRKQIWAKEKISSLQLCLWSEMDLSKTRLNGDGAVSVPPEEPRVLSLLPRRSALVPVAPRRTICNRTPHCLAAPQTICLRCVAKKRRRVKSKTFLALKRSAPVREEREERRRLMRPVLLAVTAAQGCEQGFDGWGLRPHFARPLQQQQQQRGETWQRRTAVLQVEERTRAHWALELQVGWQIWKIFSFFFCFLSF